MAPRVRRCDDHEHHQATRGQYLKCLERFKKYYSHSAERNRGAAFLGFDIVSAQLQATAGMLLRQSLAKTQKASLRMATVFLKAL
jgi:hypothetical protein